MSTPSRLQIRAVTHWDAAPGRCGLAVAALALLFLASGCHEIHFEAHTQAGDIELYDDLFSVSTADGRHVVAAGYWGSVYWSEDGGVTWHRGQSETRRLIYGVSMADDKRGWAVGQLGTIMRTEDGGRTWKPQPNKKEKEGTHLFSVHAIDPNTAWIVGEWGTRLFTRDGGVSWQDFSLSIDELHPMFVWLAPVEQDRVRSGEKVYEDVGLNDVFCLPRPSTRCWMTGEFGYIFHSDDLGTTWQRATIEGDIEVEPLPFPYNEVELDAKQVEALEQFAEQIVDKQHLNVEVEPYANPQEIARFGSEQDPSELFDILEARIQSVSAVLEQAGILSDRIRKRGRPPWDYEDFLEDDPGFLKRYLEGRRAEKPSIDVRVAQNPYLFTVRFQDEQSGWIAGLGGVILQSSDGGRSWGYRKTDRVQAIFSLDATDGRVVAVGEKGFVRVSTDGGATWKEPDSGFPRIFTFMRDIRFADGRGVGFIVGQQGLVLRSEDDGQTWTQVLPPPDRRAGGGEI